MGEQQKGYVPAYADNSSFYIPGVLHVERDDSRMLCEDDEAASVLAEEDGIRLVYGMEDVYKRQGRRSGSRLLYEIRRMDDMKKKLWIMVCVAVPLDVYKRQV